MEIGWDSKLKLEIIKEIGRRDCGVEELVREMGPRAKREVPENIKTEILVRIKSFLKEQEGI